MSETDTVAELRDRVAQAAAILQYRRAARKHHTGGVALLVAGYGDWASECFEFSRRLGMAALAEKLGTAK